MSVKRKSAFTIPSCPVGCISVFGDRLKREDYLMMPYFDVVGLRYG